MNLQLAELRVLVDQPHATSDPAFLIFSNAASGKESATAPVNAGHQALMPASHALMPASHALMVPSCTPRGMLDAPVESPRAVLPTYADAPPSNKRLRVDPAMATEGSASELVHPIFGDVDFTDELWDGVISSLEQTFGSEMIQEFFRNGDAFAELGLVQPAKYAYSPGLQGNGLETRPGDCHVKRSKTGVEQSLMQSALEFQGEDHAEIVNSPCWVNL